MTLTDSIDIDLTSCWLRGTPIPVELILRKVSEGASDAELLYAYRRLRVVEKASPSAPGGCQTRRSRWCRCRLTPGRTRRQRKPDRPWNLALFDFDGTITTGDTFTPFLRFAMVYAYGDTVEDREMLALANRRHYRWKEVTELERVG